MSGNGSYISFSGDEVAEVEVTLLAVMTVVIALLEVTVVAVVVLLDKAVVVLAEIE